MEERDLSVLVGHVDVEALGAQEVVDLVLDRLHPDVALACSFQKEESVLLDMMLTREPEARVFALDTHVLFPETYAVWREIEKRYGIQVQVFEGPSLGRQAATHGDALWERNPALCCSIRKVAPLGHALAGSTAGSPACAATSPPPAPTRRSSAGTSATSCGRRARWRTGHDDVWAYIREHELPVNELHGRGYASIGCARNRRGPRRALVGARQDRVRAPRMTSTRNGRAPLHLSHLDVLEAEAIHIMREVAAELERPSSFSRAARTRSCSSASPRRRSAPVASRSLSCTSTPDTTSRR